MEKPEISIELGFLEILKYQDNFKTVCAHECGVNHIHFPYPNEDALFIHIFKLEQDPIEITETIDQISQYLIDYQPKQRYLIFDCEYAWVRRELDAYNLIDDPKLKLVFTNGLESAVNYGARLLEKAAKYGLYG